LSISRIILKSKDPKEVFKKQWSQVLVAHAYNPSYSGGRDQEDPSSKPDPVSKKNPKNKKHKNTQTKKS
jgi:hypothetical protein